MESLKVSKIDVLKFDTISLKKIISIINKTTQLYIIEFSYHIFERNYDIH